MTEVATRQESPDFLQFVYKQLWLAAGANDEHAEAVARAVSIGDRMGKLTQGMGVLDAIFITLETGDLDIHAVPECIAEGPSWVLFDGKQSSGYWTLTRAVSSAIAKAKEHASPSRWRATIMMRVPFSPTRRWHWNRTCLPWRRITVCRWCRRGAVWRTSYPAHRFVHHYRPANSSHWSPTLPA